MGYGFGRRTPAPRRFSWDATRPRHVLAAGFSWALFVGVLMAAFPGARDKIELLATAPAAVMLAALAAGAVVLVGAAVLLPRR